MTPRDAFLRRVRQAVDEGNRAGAAAGRPERGGVGYQGSGPDAMRSFCDELTAAGGSPHLAPNRDTAWRIVLDLVRTRSVRKAVLERCALIEHLELPRRLREAGIEVTMVDNLPSTTSREAFFGADVGISGVYRLVAETGTVVMATGAQQPRSLSLLPPVHIAIAEASQLLPDLFDLFDLFSPLSSGDQSLPPSCLTLITGPSKTGDIELRLVTGVHGPGEIHVVLCTE
jgi:L-lactate dehydrogenase complex protein LldG